MMQKNILSFCLLENSKSQIEIVAVRLSHLNKCKFHQTTQEQLNYWPQLKTTTFAFVSCVYILP